MLPPTAGQPGHSESFLMTMMPILITARAGTRPPGTSHGIDRDPTDRGRQSTRDRLPRVALAAVTLWSVALATVASAQSAPPPATQAPTTQVPPPSEGLALRVWTVTLNRAPNRSLFCEAAMHGRNREAGGVYAIRLRFARGAVPTLIIAHAPPRLAQEASVALALDDRPLGTLDVRRTRLGGEEALAATLAPDWYAGTLRPALLAPEAFGLTLAIGGRVFQAPVQGWAAVMTNLDACTAELSR